MSLLGVVVVMVGEGFFVAAHGGRKYPICRNANEWIGMFYYDHMS